MSTSSTTKFVDDRDIKPFPTPCPSWCTVGQPGNPHFRHLEYEADGDRPQTRVHEGPSFGPINIDAREHLTSPGVLVWRHWVSATDEHDLRQLAADALAAAVWIEANQ